MAIGCCTSGSAAKSDTEKPSGTLIFASASSGVSSFSWEGSVLTI